MGLFVHQSAKLIEKQKKILNKTPQICAAHTSTQKYPEVVGHIS